MKPMGLPDPRTGRQPWAVVQLRQDDLAKEHYNLVGFQTKLKIGEQQRIFRMIPGLENAVFVRYGMLHRNTYIHAPGASRPLLPHAAGAAHLLRRPDHGRRGVRRERGDGLAVGLTIAQLLEGREPVPFPTRRRSGRSLATARSGRPRRRSSR